MEDESPDIIDMLILSGAVEVSGVDPTTGEFLYVMNAKMADIMPEIYEQHLTDVNRQIMNLWEAGFVSVDLLDINPLVTLTDKAFNSEEMSKLSPELYESLKEIKRVLAK